MGQNHVLQEIFEVIPPDRRDRVQAVVSKHSKMIHEALYHLTRLEIRDNESSFGKRGTLEVLLEEGHATSFRPGALNDLKSVQAQLASLKPSASKLHDALIHFQKRLKGVPDVLKEFPELQPPEGVLESCLDHARLVMDKKIAQELLPEILAVHGERFGTFTLDDTVQGGKVKLYWAVMGYFVHTKPEVSLEGLAEFVLAHELAHAFIHVGFDAISQRWVGDGFKKTDNSLKEALAQYYAVKVVEELGDKLPHARASYQALLAVQKDKDYRLHEPWLDPETGYHPEIMRAALIPLRQSGPIKKFDEFEKRLVKEKKAFPKLTATTWEIEWCLMMASDWGVEITDDASDLFGDEKRIHPSGVRLNSVGNVSIGKPTLEGLTDMKECRRMDSKNLSGISRLVREVFEGSVKPSTLNKVDHAGRDLPIKMVGISIDGKQKTWHFLENEWPDDQPLRRLSDELHKLAKKMPKEAQA